MSDFEWRTDEDSGWEDVPGTAEAPPPGAGRRLWSRLRRHWRFMVSLALLTVAGSMLVGRWVDVRLATAETMIRDEVLLTHGVLMDAARRQDPELLSTVLGGSRTWRQQQEAALERGALFDREVIGVTWQKDAEVENVIELTPDWQQAVVTSTLQYQGYVGEGVMATFGLQHLFFYERDGEQWLLAPHPDSVWASWATARGERVQTVIPLRDDEFAEQMIGELEAVVAALCSERLDCPRDLQVRVRFDRNLETIHTPTLWVNGVMREEVHVGLTAPSLVGYPQDESGFKALRKAYLRAITGKLIETMWRGSGGVGSVMHAAQQRAVMADLDLIPWQPLVENVTENFSAAGDIFGLCADGPAGGTRLIRYDALRGEWRTEEAGRAWLQMVGLEAVEGVLLREETRTIGPVQPGTVDIVWWGPDGERARFENLYFANTQGSGASFEAYTEQGEGVWVYVSAAQGCDGQQCGGVVQRDRWTVWSPDGQHTLFVAPQEGSQSPPVGGDVVWLGDAAGSPLTPFEEGFHPVWIDDETFGYLLPPDEVMGGFAQTYDLVVWHLDENGVGDRKVITIDVMNALAETAGGSELVEEMGAFVNRIVGHRSRPGTVVLSGASFANLLSSVAVPEMSAFILLVDIEQESVVALMPNTEGQGIIMPRMSSDGARIAYVSGFDPTAAETLVMATLTIDNMVLTHTVIMEMELDLGGTGYFGWWDGGAPYEWSADGTQLLVGYEGIATIVDGETGRISQLYPPSAGCGQFAWVD